MELQSQLFVPSFISWAGRERDTSVSLGTYKQQDVFNSFKQSEKNFKTFNNPQLIQKWRQLLIRNRFYYISKKKKLMAMFILTLVHVPFTKSL